MPVLRVMTIYASPTSCPSVEIDRALQVPPAVILIFSHKETATSFDPLIPAFGVSAQQYRLLRGSHRCSLRFGLFSSSGI